MKNKNKLCPCGSGEKMDSCKCHPILKLLSQYVSQLDDENVQLLSAQYFIELLHSVEYVTFLENILRRLSIDEVSLYLCLWRKAIHSSITILINDDLLDGWRNIDPRITGKVNKFFQVISAAKRIMEELLFENEFVIRGVNNRKLQHLEDSEKIMLGRISLYVEGLVLHALCHCPPAKFMKIN